MLNRHARGFFTALFSPLARWLLKIGVSPDAITIDLSKGEEGKGYRFEIAASKDEQFFVRFVAANGETMVRSETYKARASALNCIESVKKNGPGALVEDEA